NYTAKVADFGASKLGPIINDQLVTIQGLGVTLIHEYIKTGELTEKIDVYSFGVVLVELLTQKKTISFHRLEDDINLAIFFLRKLNEVRLF
ncbi:Wall-associated receptor kinase 5, partial [Bienertia sinuspersici]